MAIIVHLSDKKLSYNSGNDTKIMFSNGCWAWILSRLRSLILGLVPAQEPHSWFGTGSLLWTGTTLKPQKQLLTVLRAQVFSKLCAIIVFHNLGFKPSRYCVWNIVSTIIRNVLQCVVLHSSQLRNKVWTIIALDAQREYVTDISLVGRLIDNSRNRSWQSQLALFATIECLSFQNYESWLLPSVQVLSNLEKTSKIIKKFPAQSMKK